MLIVPVSAVPNQSLQVQVGGQSCTLNLYQQSFAFYMDVLVNGVQIIGGVICENLNLIVRSLYLGFSGDFCWVDLEGESDPDYTAIGTRYQLVYLSQSDLEALDLPTGVG
jgi:hypothetical protein